MTVYKSSVLKDDFHRDTQAFFAGHQVLVSGGGGFVGSHVVEQLLELGASVRVLSRSSQSPFLSHSRTGIDFVQGDLMDEESARKAVSGVPIVMHLAAEIGGLTYNMERPATIFQRNMKMTINILEAARQEKAKRVFLCSSACVYPRHCAIPTPEEDGFEGEPEPSNAGYGWAKRMLEFLGIQYHSEFGLSVAMARPYNAYGPRDEFHPQKSHVIPALIDKAVKAVDESFEVWGDGRASRSFLFVDDFARGVVEATARADNCDIINLGSDEEISIGDLSQMIARIVGERKRMELVPIFRSDAPTGQPRRKCDIRKAREMLGYETCVGLEEGLARTVDWYL
ncbi:MAG: NAD-dependent epimerase/dehydratase family protein, partial [Planctomycetota bacterium]|nr:NAD-dependent epimerase/dehydratase family protein [Planctomycetota bacterium]